MSVEQITPLAELTEQFRKLPGIGAKSAQRMVHTVLNWEKTEIQRFADTLMKVSREVSYCPQCFNFASNGELCNICSSTKRNKDQICVVSTVRDLFALERTHEFKGLYHVLHGNISPMEGIGPDNLRIKELIQRLSKETPAEIILALTPSTEGEATTLYLNKLLKPFVQKITRLAFGLPVGSEIDQTDELTLTKALEGRKEC
jgi:recombination protein RecR